MLETVDLEERELGETRFDDSEDKRREQSYIVRRDGEGGSKGNSGDWMERGVEVERGHKKREEECRDLMQRNPLEDFRGSLL